MRIEWDTENIEVLVFFIGVIVSSMSRAPFQDARFFGTGYWVLG